MSRTGILVILLLGLSVSAAGLYMTRNPRPVSFHVRSAALVEGTMAAFRNYDAVPPQIVAHHTGDSGVANRVLLIRRLDVVEKNPHFSVQDPNAPWGFTSLVSRAWHLANPTDPQLTVEHIVQNWVQPTEPLRTFNTIWQDRDPSRQLKNIPLRMLALVNRLDLANVGSQGCAAGLVCGAEIRFVYAGVTEPPPSEYVDAYFTLILEFVLRPMTIEEFRALASKWASLETMPDPEPVLSETMDLAKSARIRVNGRAAAVWQFGEYEFQPDGIHTVDLTRQPAIDSSQIKACQDRGSPLAKFLSANLGAVRNSDYSFEGVAGLSTYQVDLPEATANVLTLDKTVAGPDVLDQLRFTLSINSCVGCHGLEARSPHLPASVVNARTLFDQVRYRKPGQQSELAGFLTGGDTGEPSVSFLTVAPPVVANCAGTPAVRHYNDLLRRHLFLYTVLQLKENTPAEWKRELDDKGLTAWQPH